jgi:hypothetical protein
MYFMASYYIEALFARGWLKDLQSFSSFEMECVSSVRKIALGEFKIFHLFIRRGGQINLGMHY